MELTKLKQQIDKTVQTFIRKYFEIPKREKINYDSISVHLFQFNDYFLDLDDIVHCLENNVPTERFFEWYNYCVDYNTTVSLDFFLRGTKYSEREIREAEMKVKIAEEIFKKEVEKLAHLKNY